MSKVYLGIAAHPRSRERLERAVSVTMCAEDFAECDGAIVYTPPDEWIDAQKAIALRVVGCHAHSEAFGIFAARCGIRIILAQSLWRTVAEHTLALLMTAARNTASADADIRAGGWCDHAMLKIRYAGLDFQGKTLGILGFGQIGRELAGLVSGFRMRILYNDLSPLSLYEKRLRASFCPLDELLAQSDFLAVLVPLNDTTRGMLGTREFALLKPGCVLVNTARGPIIQEKALLDALREDRVAAAGLDVYWDEPLPSDHSLLGLRNVVLAPHLGGSTYECDSALVEGVLDGLGLV